MSKHDITILLQQANAGDLDVLSEIYSKLYGDIKKIAQFQINKLQTGQTITPTVLAHECYLKMLKLNDVRMKDRKHFLNCLSISMRQLLVDIYRAKLSPKRNFEAMTQSMTDIVGTEDIDFRILELDQLLNKVEEINKLCAQVLNFKLILTMTFPEIAEVMDMSERQIKRIWVQGKSLLMVLSEDT